MQSDIGKTPINFHSLWDRLQCLTGCIDEIIPVICITHICPQLDQTGYVYFVLWVVIG